MDLEWNDEEGWDDEKESMVRAEKFWLPRVLDRSRFEPEWFAKWTPRCPDGNAQRLCEIVGFRLKGADYLSLRVILRHDDHHTDGGVCQMVVEEHDDVVFVLALACFDDVRDAPQAGRKRKRGRHEMNCPCNVWLDAPLGERVVVNYETDEPLPFVIPHWGEGKPDEYVPRPSGDLWQPPDVGGRVGSDE